MPKDYKNYEEWAQVEDYIIGSEYKISLVDGKTPTRLQHGKMVTVVPLVVIPAGKHVLTVIPFDSINPNKKLAESTELSVTINKSGHYRLKTVDGAPTLIDLSDEPRR